MRREAGRWRRPFWLCLAGLSPLGSATAAAPVPTQAGHVTVAPADSLPREAEAGSGFTAAFIAVNGSAAGIAGVTSASAPPGWRVLSNHGPIKLASRAREVILVSIVIPYATVAGSYAVRMRFVSALGETTEGVMQIRIGARRDVRISLVEAPTFVPAGATYSATHSVNNRGNTSERIHFRAKNPAGFPVTIEPQEMTLAPGETRRIRAVVLTRADLPDVVANSVTITVESVGEALDPAAVRVSSSIVDVIPVAVGGEESSRTLPLVVTVKNAQALGSSQSGMVGREQKVEVAGSGPLDESGQTRFDLRVNAREPGGSLLEDRDEYRLAISHPVFDIVLGDRIYALTPLLDPGRYGFGAGGRLTLGRLTMGGFAHRPRQIASGEQGRAAFAAFRLPAGSELSVNRLLGGGPGIAPSRLSSVRARMFQATRGSMDFEYASGGREGSIGRAATGQVSAAFGWTSFEVRHTVSDSAFSGAFGPALRESNARIALTPWRKLWFRGSHYERASVPPTQLVDTVAVEDRNRYEIQVAGFGYGTFGLEHERTTRERGMSEDDQQSQELNRLRANRRVGRFHLTGTLERGSSRLGPTEEQRIFTKAGTSASLILGRQTLSMTAERVSGPTISSGPVGERMQGRFSAFLRLGTATDLRLTAYGYQLIGSERQTFGLLDATLSRQLRANQSMSLRIRRMTSGTAIPDRNIIEIGYRIPLEIPIPGSSQGGVVRAHVFDGVTRSPVAGALVRLGNRVLLTDAEGEAVFSGVASEMQTLQLDRRGASGGMIPQAGTSLTTTVARGRRVTVEIPLATAGRVIGRVRRFDIAEFGTQNQGGTPRLLESDSIPRLIIALSNGDQERRRSIDDLGNFEFADVPPGAWTARVIAGQLPDRYLVADSIVEVAISGADTARIEMRLIPRERRMRIVSSGRVTVSSVDTASGVTKGSLPSRTTAVAQPPVAPKNAETSARSAPERAEHWYYVAATDHSILDVASKAYREAAVTLWPKIWLANRKAVPDPNRLGAVRWILIPSPGPLSVEERAALNEYLESERRKRR